jgi:hypothetical protein
MISKNAKKYNIEPNEQYGAYITIEEIEKIGKKSIERLWKVKHIITEKERIMRPSYLIIVRNKYDEILKTKSYQNGLKKYLFNQYIRGAKIRNHDFNLNYHDFIQIITKNCHYCGEPPKKSTPKILINRGNINEPPLYYNGIDRIDSNLNYDIDNVIPCCSTCNYMKHIMTQEHFIEQIKKIYNHMVSS